MLIRELTKEVRQPIVENDYLGYALKGLGWLGSRLASASNFVIPSSNPYGEYSDMSPHSNIFNKLEPSLGAEEAHRLAQEMKQLVIKGDPSAEELYRKVMGADAYKYPFDPVDANGYTIKPTKSSDTDKNLPPMPDESDPNMDAGGKTIKPTPPTPVGASTVTKGNTVGMPSLRKKIPNPNIGYGKGKVDPGLAVAAKIPNMVKNPAAASTFAASNPQTAQQYASGIAGATGGALSATATNTLATTAAKYALPAAAVIALLYGGKKLLDYAKSKKGVKEQATAGATSSGNIAAVANPVHAHGEIPRDKNGVPKKKARKNKDGTVVSALDTNDSFFGGKVAKR